MGDEHWSRGKSNTFEGKPGGRDRKPLKKWRQEANKTGISTLSLPIFDERIAEVRWGKDFPKKT